MIRRQGYGALWSLPVTVAFYQSIAGATGLLLLYAGLYAALAFDPMSLRRRLLRLALWIFALVLATGLWPHGLRVPEFHHLIQSLRVLTPKKLDTADATLLLSLLLPALTASFESLGTLALRLLQLVLGIGLLSYVGSLEVNVAASAVALCLGFIAVRYFDLGREPAHGRRSLEIYGAISIGLVLLAGQTLPPLRPSPGGGTLVQQGYPLDIGQLDQTLIPATNAAFTSTSRAALYWQVFTAYDYTGQGWKQAGSWRTLVPGQESVRPGPGTRLVLEHVTLAATLPTDPVAGNVVELLSPPGAWLYNARSGAYRADGRDIEIIAALPSTTLRAARAVPVSARGAPRSALQLPRTLPSAVSRLAHRIIKGVRPTVGSEAAALIGYLHSHEQYVLQVPSDGGRDFVWDFLFVHHAGDCNSFSSAFVVLARADGIAARWVAGYLPGSPEQGGRVVTAADAHSWAEVWVPGHGWLPLDPTPGFALPSLQRGGGATAAASATGALPTVQVGRLGRAQALRALERAAQRESLARARARASQAPLDIAFVLGLVVLALAVWTLGHRTQAEVLYLRLWSYTCGKPWRRNQTVREWLGGAAPHLCRHVEWRLYGVPGGCPVGAREAWRELWSLRHGRKA